MRTLITRQDVPITGTLDLRVIGIPIILAAGLIGALSPLFLQAWQNPHNLLQRMTRSFSGGAILALAIIHVLPDAYDALEQGMGGGNAQLLGGSTLLLGVFAMVFIESMANQMLCPSHSQTTVHIHGCNQYHTSDSRGRQPGHKQVAGEVDGVGVSQPLLSGDLVSDGGGEEEDLQQQELVGQEALHNGVLQAGILATGASTVGGQVTGDGGEGQCRGADGQTEQPFSDGSVSPHEPRHIVNMQRWPSTEDKQLEYHSNHPNRHCQAHHNVHKHQHPMHLGQLHQQLQQHQHHHTLLHKRCRSPQLDHAHMPPVGPEPGHTHIHSHDSHHHHQAKQSIQRKVMAYMLELGCVFHSLFIGVSLGVTIEGRQQVLALIVALAVHQLLEGLALGSVVAAANFGRNSGAYMSIMYSLTTPFGVGLGILVSEYYEAVSSAGLLVQGLANAASAGMLLYIALVQLVAEHNKYVAQQFATSGAEAAAAAAPGQPSALPLGPSANFASTSLRHQRICWVPGTILLSHAALVAGAGLMWVLAFWA